MLAVQYEEIIMIEIAQPVHPIMTGQAITAISLLVVAHKFFIVLSVAVNTRLQRKLIQALWVAGTTGYHLV